MIVFDRSGSMELDAGTGRTKIEEARDAGPRCSSSSCRATAPVRSALCRSARRQATRSIFALQPVNDASKLALTGPAPFTGGIVGGIVTDGTTSIGGGLEAARDQFAFVGQRAVHPAFDRRTAKYTAPDRGCHGTRRHQHQRRWFRRCLQPQWRTAHRAFRDPWRYLHARRRRA